MVSLTIPFVILLTLLCVAVPATAHMALSDPPPLRYKTNPYKTDVDYTYIAPLKSNGSDYPCKGYHKDLGSPSAKSVVTWSQGGSYKIRLEGSSTHAGGSCQGSLSYDGGNTWNLIKSWIGGCVRPAPGSDQNFDLQIPTSVPGGEALFAWTWFNNQGDREMYMNCAVVTISGGRKSRSIPAEELVTPRASGSSIFVANIGNGCTTVAGKDVAFPDPGSQVEYGGLEADRAAPQGSCGSGPPPPMLPGPTNSSGGSGGNERGGGNGGSGGGGENRGGGGNGTGGNTKSCEHSKTKGHLCSRAAGRGEELQGVILLMILVTLTNWFII